MATKKEETKKEETTVGEAVVNEKVAEDAGVKNEVSVVDKEGDEGNDGVEEAEFDMATFEGVDLAALGFSEEEIKELSGLDKIGANEIRIPYATLISKKTRDNDVGDVVFADGTVVKGLNDEVAEEISVLKIQPVRVYFPENFNPNNSFICRSLDGIVGAPDGKFAGRACDTCEFAKYPEAGGASPCRDQRLLLCTDKDGALFHLQVGGVGVGVWKSFMSSQVFHLLPKARGILGALRVKIGVKMVNTSYGEFPALDFRIDKKKPYHGNARLIANLNSLKSYKEFEDQHIRTAADQARVQMAAGELEQEGNGNRENNEAF